MSCGIRTNPDDRIREPPAANTLGSDLDFSKGRLEIEPPFRKIEI
jgi:hypothetical protein